MNSKSRNERWNRLIVNNFCFQRLIVVLRCANKMENGMPNVPNESENAIKMIRWSSVRSLRSHSVHIQWINDNFMDKNNKRTKLKSLMLETKMRKKATKKKKTSRSQTHRRWKINRKLGISNTNKWNVWRMRVKRNINFRHLTHSV